MEALTEEECLKLKSFKVGVIGCGGLGGYIIEMLSRIGVGYIAAVDGDVFQRSNLNRQILSSSLSIGKNKAREAKDRMMYVNPDVKVEAFEEMLNENNAERILKGLDLAVDALDNIDSRLLLQSKAKEYNIPIIHGSIGGWYGQVTTILPGDNTLKFIYREGTKSGIEKKLGNPSFIPPLIASIQVSEAIKLLLNKGDILRKKILFVDILNNDFNIIEV
ncbi:HesA/MoeB/ThiF family protein [Caloramator sp. E03]|uniref:HesA/MoeB/ThiF family protein n=1 Tax=Caloramator sp. E03 TaxID=2576307 RepID=UPI00111011DB|nr:HesA/MoeB/ThiF family protein [Caloramator sp. E03]QCX34841.1 HesA/MoeB/ThiF family protein [Caloramator sp. E03]